MLTSRILLTGLRLIRDQLRRLESAVHIQRHWRGFLRRADYMFTVADIILAQSAVRRFLEKR